MTTKLNLTTALDLFEDNLDDIKNAIAINLKDKLDTLPPVQPTDNPTLQWVRDEVRKIEIENITTQPLKIIRRIQTRQYYESVPEHQQYDRITDEDKIRAKEMPIEDMYMGDLKKSGGRLWGICPFHEEDTSSFFIDEENRWHCFGACSTGGDAIDFIMKRDNVDFIQAVKSLVR
jgi:hypothetical protein